MNIIYKFKQEFQFNSFNTRAFSSENRLIFIFCLKEPLRRLNNSRSVIFL